VTAVWGLIEALRDDDDSPRAWHGWRLLVSGAALSLDDLAAGLALGTVRYSIIVAVALFGHRGSSVGSGAAREERPDPAAASSGGPEILQTKSRLCLTRLAPISAEDI
jgi:hypothetical protein